jgi:uncharacterized protein YggU (UPF0235/DUF167 family)
MSPRFRVRVHPGARRAGVTGRLADGAWKIAVTEAPEGGRANRALETLLADALGVARDRVGVVLGAGSRGKTVEVSGLGMDEIERRLERARRATNGEPDGE